MGRRTAVLVVLLLVAVGCGKQQDSGTVDASGGAHALADAAAHTASARTGKVHMTETTTGSSDGSDAGSGTVTGDGAYDLDAGLSSMTTTMDSGGSGLTPGTLPDANGASQEMIIQGRTEYLKVASPIFAGAPAGKWVRFDGGFAGMGTGTGTDSASGWNPMTNPSDVLGFLQGVGSDVNTVGHETIDGTKTTHLHSSFTESQFVQANAGPNGTDPSPTTPGWLNPADPPIQIEVFIDGDHYVRRIVATEEMTADASIDGTSMPPGSDHTTITTFDYSDFGQPVSINVPAAADTVSLCDLMKQTATYDTTMVSVETAPAPGCS